MQGCHLSFACMGRFVQFDWPQLDARGAATKAIEFTAKEVAPVAIIFGRERIGLTNTEAQQCTYHLSIPTQPNYSSLNLAQAVQVVSYECFMASVAQAEQEAAQQVRIFWPNQDGRGVHVNISGGAITASSKNKQLAIALLEFLVSDSAQQWYAETNLEYPVKPGVQPSEILKSWGEFKADTLSLHRLGELNGQAVMIMDHAVWK